MANHVASGRSVEASGKTVEQAIEAALDRFGRQRNEVQIQVLREASRGVLGFGAHDAIVRVTEIARPPSPAGAEPAVQPPAPTVMDEWAEEAAEVELPDTAGYFEEDDFGDELAEEDEERGPRGEATPDDMLRISRETLLDILERMYVIADVLAMWREPEEQGDEPTLILDIVGDDLGLLIGRRGET
ncbi:MAG: Jag N-terminal domain-containing protein, partial [Ardenticatenaceae bacterium]